MPIDSDPLALTESLEGEVRAAFAVEAKTTGLSTGETLAALKTLNTRSHSLAAAQALDSAQANAQDQALLNWIDSVFDYWQAHFPMAAELMEVLNQARPLAAAFALTDKQFFLPGGHGAHRLLDLIHDGFVGWHPGLGASAQSVPKHIEDCLNNARQDFPNEFRVDTVIAALTRVINDHQTRLGEMESVLLQREASLLGDTGLKLEVAHALNGFLRSHRIPRAVEQFIRADWFPAGIKIAEQHSFDSEAWLDYLETTRHLFDAMQPQEQPSGITPEAIKALPQQLATQLESLGSDRERINNAVGLIEYALLRSAHGGSLDAYYAPSLSTASQEESGPSGTELAQLGLIQGHWFAWDSAEGLQRLRYVGALGGNNYLLFMDFEGARALRKSTREIQALLSSGELVSLYAPDSFCRAMMAVTAERYQEHAAGQDVPVELATSEAIDQEHCASIESGWSEELASATTYSERASADEEEPVELPAAIAASDENDALPATEPPFEGQTVVKLQLPMGTWLGFHDREPPLMAKVAVRDPEKDSYIFTNRAGVKLRELTVNQLLALIDRDMVDILERKSGFKDAIKQMSQEQDRLTER